MSFVRTDCDMHRIETDIIISNSIHVDVTNLEGKIMYSYKEESVMGRRGEGERGEVPLQDSPLTCQ